MALGDALEKFLEHDGCNDEDKKLSKRLKEGRKADENFSAKLNKFLDLAEEKAKSG
jgi:hypothetical protein